MTDEALPTFRYHPDPVATGAFDRIGRRCVVCDRERGWSYVFGTYGEDDLRDDVCPWCIADGSAAERFDVVFTEVAPDASGAAGAEVADRSAVAQRRAVIDEIERRTPGFSGWQTEQWLFHCDDAAAFLGPVGWEQVEEHPDAVDDLRRRIAGWGMEPDDVEAVIGSLDVDGSATGYLFRCLHCGVHLAYADMD